MLKRNMLINNLLLYGFAHFGSMALSLFMLPIYTYYFKPDEFGLWDVVLSTVTLIIPFITFELISATYRWLLEANTLTEYKTIITTGFVQLIRQLSYMNFIVLVLFIFWDFPFKWHTLIFINSSVLSSFLLQTVRGLKRNK